MKTNNPTEINKTEESIFTLLSLTTQITQAYDSIFDNEDILNSNFEKLTGSYHDLINDTIYDALASQIMLKTVAYLDEWNNYFGVHTNPEDRDKIKMVKRIAKPAYNCIKEWKGLEKYRNNLLAHNHRDKEKRNVLLNSIKYNIPETDGELLLLCFCVQKMSDIVSTFFQEEVGKIINLSIFNKAYEEIENEPDKYLASDFIEKLKFVEEAIKNEIMKVSMKQ